MIASRQAPTRLYKANPNCSYGSDSDGYIDGNDDDMETDGRSNRQEDKQTQMGTDRHRKAETGTIRQKDKQANRQTARQTCRQADM